MYVKLTNLFRNHINYTYLLLIIKMFITLKTFCKHMKKFLSLILKVIMNCSLIANKVLYSLNTKPIISECYIIFTIGIGKPKSPLLSPLMSWTYSQKNLFRILITHQPALRFLNCDFPQPNQNVFLSLNGRGPHRITSEH
jgi:hypothetical protein